ncbi:MAG: carboxypeptidase-like regulatory domain-containing protein, partial [Anaerolineae bacterium]
VGRPLYELLRPLGDEEEYIIPPTFAPEPFAFWPPASLQGKLKGGAGHKVHLSLARDGSSQEAVVGQDEAFAFRGLRPGVYTLRVEGTNLEISKIALSSGDERYLELEMPAWRWHIAKRPAILGFAMVLCAVEGRAGLPVRIWNDVWEGMERLTGSKPSLGPYYCELAPLAAGRYWLQPRGITPAVELELETDTILDVVFTPIGYAEPAPASAPAQAPAGEVETAPAASGLDLYLLLARPLASKEELSAVLRFLQRHAPACGFSVEEASWAKRVLIVGGANLRVTEDDEHFLRQKGCQVQRVTERVAETLAFLARQGDPMAYVTSDRTS